MCRLTISNFALQSKEPAPEIDFFAMDDPTPAANDGFDAFQAAPAAAAPPVDSFDAFQSAPASAQQASSGFDAFQSAPTPTPVVQQQNQFDAFGATPTPNNSQRSFDAFGNGRNATSGNSNSMNNAFGNMSMGGNNNMMGMQQQMVMGGQANVMGGSRSNVMGAVNNMSSIKQQSPPQNDDDFGDFDDGVAGKRNKSSDPLSNLISLDGLTKNDKKVDKTHEPIAFNDAAKAYIQSGAQHAKPVGMSKAAADFAFSGVDGLHNQSSFHNVNTMGSNLQQGQSAMGSGGGNPMMNNMGSQMGQMQHGMMGGGMQQYNMGMTNSGMGMGTNMNNGQGMQQGMGNNVNVNNMSNMMGSQGQQMGGTMGGQQMGGMNNNMNNNGMGGFGNNTMPMGGQPMGGQPMGGGWQ